MASYKLIKEDMVVKVGKISIPNRGKAIRNVWKSTEKFTWMYMDQFKQNADLMAKEMVEVLLTEI